MSVWICLAEVMKVVQSLAATASVLGISRAMTRIELGLALVMRLRAELVSVLSGTPTAIFQVFEATPTRPESSRFGPKLYGPHMMSNSCVERRERQ